MRVEQNAVGEEIVRACELTLERLEQDRYDLLARGGLAELYYLPERIAKLLGWASAGRLLIDTPELSLRASEAFIKLLRFVLKHYSTSLVVMSDAQAPFWATAISQAISLGALDEAEELAGLLFNSLLSSGGMVARDDLAPERVLEFLTAKQTREVDNEIEILARPVAITTVLLLSARRLGLVDAFDPGLWMLDGESFAAYVNPNVTEWGAAMMRSGKYAVWHIGLDFFRTDDILGSWPDIETVAPSDPVLAAGLVIASLVYPDRVAWHLIRPEPAHGTCL